MSTNEQDRTSISNRIASSLEESATQYFATFTNRFSDFFVETNRTEDLSQWLETNSPKALEVFVEKFGNAAADEEVTGQEPGPAQSIGPVGM